MKHIIKKQILALEIPSGADSWKNSDDFKELFNTDVLPRLERICDEMGIHEGITLKLDTLTIDTGDIDSQNISVTWPEKIEQGFREELKKYTAEKLGAKQSQILQSAEQTELEVLIHFLEHGTLPWYVSDQDKTSPATLFTKLLKEQPKTLAEKISASKSKVSLSNRLIRQFIPSQVNQLLQHFKTPSSHIPINWLQKEIGKISTEITNAFKSSFLFVKTITSIDSTISGKDHFWYFDLLFEHFIDLNTSGQKKTLSSINKNLNYRYLNTKNLKSLEDKDRYSLALQSLEKYLDKNDDSNSGFINKNRRQKEVDLTESVLSTANKETDQSETTESLNQVDEFEQRTNEDENLRQNELAQPDNSSDKERGAHLSSEKDQDERVREHLERIKKQQIAKLHDAKQQPFNSLTAKGNEQAGNSNNPNETSTSSIDKDQEDNASQNNDITSKHVETLHSKKSELDQNDTTNKSHQEQSTHKTAQKALNEQSLIESNDSGHPKKLISDQPDESDFKAKKVSQHKAPDSIIHNPKDKTLDANHQALDTKLGTANADHQTLNIEQKTKRASIQRNPQYQAINSKQETSKPKHQTPNRLKYWQEEPEAISECYIVNAGLVLFWPYLGHFFKDLELIEKGKFHSPKHQEEAALTLQYLLSTEPELDEHLLPLNKLLCGLKISEPIGRQLEFSQDDRKKCDNLLETAIQNWPALRATTISGFQKSFLNRKGVLKRHENHWQLQIEKMPFDMLIEQLPWPIGIVRLSWMNKPLYVEW